MILGLACFPSCVHRAVLACVPAATAAAVPAAARMAAASSPQQAEAQLAEELKVTQQLLHRSVNSFRFLRLLLWFALGPGDLREAPGSKSILKSFRSPLFAYPS